MMGLRCGAVLLLCLITAIAPAQEGFPLDGTWRGEWNRPDGKSEPVVIVMTWDGEHINGTINPGRNAAKFSAATLNAEDWRVRIEATLPTSGRVEISGVLQDLGSYHRYIEGTWVANGVSHELKATRQ